MAFIRRKVVHGYTYLYLVENRRVGGKVRQTVLQYLGRDPADGGKSRKGTSGVIVVRRPSRARRTERPDE